VTLNPLDYAPYDNMVGTWIGTFAIFDTAGHYIVGGPSRYLVHWKNRPTLMHFRQDQDLTATAKALIENFEKPLNDLLEVDSAAQVIRDLAGPDYDLTITGNAAKGEGPGPAGRPVQVSAAELSPDVCHFEIVETGSKARYRWHNTHIFPTQNQRRTIGPVVGRESRIGLIMLHTYTRISLSV
jgi:hypothetical protein